MPRTQFFKSLTESTRLIKTKRFVIFYLLVAALLRAEGKTGAVGPTKRDMKVGAVSFLLGTLSMGVVVYAYQTPFTKEAWIKYYFKDLEGRKNRAQSGKLFMLLDALLEQLFPEEKAQDPNLVWSYAETYARVSKITYASVAPEIACEDKTLIRIKKETNGV